MYHIGLSKRGKTLVIEMVRNIDFLSCEIYSYMGQRITTKASVRARRYELLNFMKQRNPDVYGNLRYAVVV